MIWLLTKELYFKLDINVYIEREIERERERERERGSVGDETNVKILSYNTSTFHSLPLK